MWLIFINCDLCFISLYVIRKYDQFMVRKTSQSTKKELHKDHKIYYYFYWIYWCCLRILFSAIIFQCEFSMWKSQNTIQYFLRHKIDYFPVYNISQFVFEPKHCFAIFMAFLFMLLKLFMFFVCKMEFCHLHNICYCINRIISIDYMIQPNKATQNGKHKYRIIIIIFLISSLLTTEL